MTKSTKWIQREVSQLLSELQCHVQVVKALQRALDFKLNGRSDKGCQHADFVNAMESIFESDLYCHARAQP